MAAVGTTSRWAFPPVDTADEHGLLGVGADLEPATLVHAYRSGIFPMPVGRRMGWWSPDPRGILPLERLVVSRSLRRSVRRYEVRIDTSFVEVLRGCADPRRPNGWINQAVERAYLDLHDLGIAHSVEAWDAHTGELAGGLYGVAIGGLFAGESMFHRTVDASKVALVALVDAMRSCGGKLLDVQWATDHLVRLGAVEIPRERYLELAAAAVGAPPMTCWDRSTANAAAEPTAATPSAPTTPTGPTEGSARRGR